MESEASIILTGETTTTIEKSDKSSTSNPLMVVRRKGDKIYYVKDENIWMNDNEIRQSKPNVQKASIQSATKETENIINSESSVKKSVKARCQICNYSDIQLDDQTSNVKKKSTKKTEAITKLAPVEQKEKYYALPRSKQKKVTDVKEKKELKKSCVTKSGDCDCTEKECKCPYPYVLQPKPDAYKEKQAPTSKDRDKIKDAVCHCCQADLSNSDEELEVIAIDLNNDMKEQVPSDNELIQKQDLSTEVYKKEIEIDGEREDSGEIDGDILIIQAESLSTESVKSTVDLSQLDTSDVRKVSMILPTGEVEVIERQKVDDWAWEKPKIKRKGLATPKDSFALLQHQHLLKEGSKVLDPNYFKSSSATANTKLSYKLPSGKIEVLEREYVEDTDWEMPKNYCKYPRSILASVPSLEIFKTRMSKSKSYSNRSADDLKPILKNSKTIFQSVHYNSENSRSELYIKSPRPSTASSDSDKYSQFSERQSF
ncbi:unnamed protein product [Diabrotica balteata]|uniref:Uncharacterized protein n=1 Tax=Diabrotica balteata TaxID=107213 RepID=A0A9N9XCW1_DIABA|nr:unnamed protein product [Diabrotica balteata]